MELKQSGIPSLFFKHYPYNKQKFHSAPKYMEYIGKEWKKLNQPEKSFWWRKQFRVLAESGPPIVSKRCIIGPVTIKKNCPSKEINNLLKKYKNRKKCLPWEVLKDSSCEYKDVQKKFLRRAKREENELKKYNIARNMIIGEEVKPIVLSRSKSKKKFYIQKGPPSSVQPPMTPIVLKRKVVKRVPPKGKIIHVKAEQWPIGPEHLKSLEPGQYLVDRIIDSYFAFLGDIHQDKVIFFSTTFFPIFQKRDPIEIGKRVEDISGKDLFIPVNYNENHWVLFWYSVKEKSIIILDPLRYSSINYTAFTKWFSTFLRAAISVKGEIKIVKPNSKQQTYQHDLFSCGIYILIYGYLISNGRELVFDIKEFEDVREDLMNMFISENYQIQ